MTASVDGEHCEEGGPWCGAVVWGCSDLAGTFKVRFSYLSHAIKSKFPCGCMSSPASHPRSGFMVSPLLQQYLCGFAKASCSTKGVVIAKPFTKPFPSPSSSLPSNTYLIFRMVQLEAKEKEREEMR